MSKRKEANLAVPEPTPKKQKITKEPAKKPVKMPVKKPAATVVAAKKPVKKPAMTVVAAKMPVKKLDFTVVAAKMPVEKPAVAVVAAKMPVEKPAVAVVAVKQVVEKPAVAVVAVKKVIKKLAVAVVAVKKTGGKRKIADGAEIKSKSKKSKRQPASVRGKQDYMASGGPAKKVKNEDAYLKEDAVVAIHGSLAEDDAIGGVSDMWIASLVETVPTDQTSTVGVKFMCPNDSEAPTGSYQFILDEEVCDVPVSSIFYTFTGLEVAGEEITGDIGDIEWLEAVKELMKERKIKIT
jgi:hypothetical protein